MKINKFGLVGFIIFVLSVIISNVMADFYIPFLFAILMEAFVTIHMSFFVLIPLSNILSPPGSNNLFWKMFWFRIVILMFNNIFISTSIALIDFNAVFIGAFIIVPILSIKKKNAINSSIPTTTKKVSNPEVASTCAKCGKVLEVNHNFCTNCGEPFDSNNVTVTMNSNSTTTTAPNVPVYPSSFDPIYNLPEKEMVEEFINREIIKAGIDKNNKLIPEDILKRKKILSIIFSVLVFVFISLIFFHFPIYTYIIGILLLIVLYKVTTNYNLIKYLKKQLKSRPSEKISNIVMNVKETSVVDNSKNLFIIGMCLAILLPLIIFFEPRIFYEKMENGYGVRFYVFGLTNFTTATIPDTYKGEPIISLRGNTFSNMFFLEKVNLPNSITEIRGQAFKNNRKLKEVNLPTKLEYLGGGAFYNCTSLTSIEIPETVTHIGGETFYNASKLKSINLPNNITEIRGSTFENCRSLKSVNIPDSVTRIGGHAFHGCSSLSQVTLTENSLLTEIGSSAFRDCDNLYEITIPNGVYINERAFKESPTRIKKFGEIDYGNLIDSKNYSYNSYLYIHLNETQEINPYRQNAQLQNANISLVSTANKNNLNVFTLKYTDDNGEIIFDLSATSPYKEINDKFAIEVANEYVFQYDNRISVNIYFN